MGSAQSVPAPVPIENPKERAELEPTIINSTFTTSNSNLTKKKKSPPQNLKGFNLIQYKCRRKKQTYDLCHSNKHEAFVNGEKLQDQEGDELSCEEMFDIYKECIYKGMHKDRNKRGLAPPTEESALGTFAEDADDE